MKKRTQPIDQVERFDKQMRAHRWWSKLIITGKVVIGIAAFLVAGAVICNYSGLSPKLASLKIKFETKNNRVIGWSGPYVARDNISPHVVAYDNFESYRTGASLDGLNGGVDISVAPLLVKAPEIFR